MHWTKYVKHCDNNIEIQNALYVIVLNSGHLPRAEKLSATERENVYPVFNGFTLFGQ